MNLESIMSMSAMSTMRESTSLGEKMLTLVAIMLITNLIAYIIEKQFIWDVYDYIVTLLKAEKHEYRIEYIKKLTHVQQFDDNEYLFRTALVYFGDHIKGSGRKVQTNYIAGRYQIYSYPNGWTAFKIGDQKYRIRITEQKDRLENSISHSLSLHIKSNLSYDEFKKLLESRMNVKLEEERRKQKYYLVLPKKGIQAYNYDPDKTLDDIISDEKQHIVQSVDKLQAGKISKMVMLLYGEPGCGKTSFIKAISQYTGRSIMYCKLSQISDFNSLLQVIYGTYFKNDNDMLPEIAAVNKRILVIEEIDTEKLKDRNTDFVELIQTAKKESRKESSKSTMDNSDDSNDLDESIVGLTLGDILSALDGVLTMRGLMIIMTTNHIDHLDPALIRPGRITHKIKLGKFRSNDCAKYIEMKFGEEIPAEVFPHEKFTPAEFEGMCEKYGYPDVMTHINAEKS